MKFILAAVVLFSSAASAQSIYKCQDADGKTRLTDRPCTGGQELTTLPRSGSDQGLADWERGAKWVEDNEQRRQATADRRREQAAPPNNSGLKGPQLSKTELESLQRSCDIQRGSLARDRNGTPACDQLDRIYGVQKPAKIIVHNDGGSGGPTTRFDQYGNPYTDFNNGSPVINQRTGRPCTNLGGNNIRCD